MSVVGFAFAGCVLAPTTNLTASATEPVPVRRHLVRSVAIRSAPAATTVPLAVRSVVVSSAPEPPTPWARFDAALTGPTYSVAHARGPRLGVSAVVGGPELVTLSNPTKLGAPRVVLVVADAGEWLQVLLPLRPNSSLGWIRRADIDLTTSTLRVEIDRAAHQLRVIDGTTTVMEERVGVGRASAPTPTGQFFVTELLRPPNPSGAYGPFAFTLSGYSVVYQRFGSGDGAVGLHGTNEPASIGADASHGCIRIGNDAVRRLAAMLPLGTPVVIR